MKLRTKIFVGAQCVNWFNSQFTTWNYIQFLSYMNRFHWFWICFGFQVWLHHWQWQRITFSKRIIIIWYNFMMQILDLLQSDFRKNFVSSNWFKVGLYGVTTLCPAVSNVKIYLKCGRIFFRFSSVFITLFTFNIYLYNFTFEITCIQNSKFEIQI